MDRITKVYDNGFVANSQVTLSVNEGELHALIGENGAGKTTLMKILFGLEAPQEGRILICGEEVHIKNSLDAIAHGVGMVHQHFMQVADLSIAENIVLGIEPNKLGVFDKKKAIEMTAEAAKKYQFDIDPNALIRDVSVGVKQKVEILKALIRGVRILILDEPTAVLTPQETRELFAQLKGLRESGYSIIFISHKLDEILELCDRVTVMRHGRTVCEAELLSGMTESRLSAMMVGRDVITEPSWEAPKTGKPILTAKDVTYRDNTGRTVLNHVSFSVRAGEVVGIAGVEGNGQSELSDILAGLMKATGGSITLNGKETGSLNIHKIRASGLAYISEDRMIYGCAPELSIRDNLLSTRLDKAEFKIGPFVNKKRADEYVRDCIRDFEIACSSPDMPIKGLSGGNIQKVIVAREFTSGANLIVVNQPTRGIDIGVTTLIRSLLVKYTREKGMGVLLISSDLNEIFEITDRLLVMRKGRIAAVLDDVAAVTDEMLGEYMLGIKTMTPEEMEGKL